MEENQVKVLFNRAIPSSYEELENMFKQIFNQPKINNLTFNDGNEKTEINKDNYQDYVISAIELSHTNKKILLKIDPKKEEDKLTNKFNENLDLLKKKIRENNELKKKNKELENDIQKLKEDEEIRKKKINEEDKEEIMNEIDRKNKIIDQKCKILDAFEEFKEYMKEDKQYLDQLNATQDKYKKNFESEIKQKLEEIKQKLINETKEKCENAFQEYIQSLQNAEKKRKEEYEKGLESINYRMLIENSDLIHYNYQCSHCKSKPIIGVLYKCEHCDNVYLCEKCEEENYHANTHPYNFIKIRKTNKKNIDENKVEEEDKFRNNNIRSDNNNNRYPRSFLNNNPYQREVINQKNNNERQRINSNNNNINNKNKEQKSDSDSDDKIEKSEVNPMLLNTIYNKNIFDNIVGGIKNNEGNNQMEKFNKRNQMENPRNEIYNKNLYSFNCQFENNGIYEFDMSKKIKPEITFKLRNISNIDWKENGMYLKTNKNSELVINEYKLSNLRKGDSQKVKLNIPKINEIPDGTYNISLDFCVNNQIYGEPIKLKVKIIQDENLIKIFNFRSIYQLNENEYTNEQILFYLKKNKFNFEKTFNEMFDN